MNTATLGRLASAATISGIAVLAFAAPASAMVADPPGAGEDGSSSTTSVTLDGGTNWTGIAIGGVGGIALFGAGAATAGALRRHHHPTHAVT